MPQTGCVLPSLSPHPTSPLRSCLNLRPLVPHPCTCCCPAATHTVVIPAARQVSTHVGGHVRYRRHVESAILGAPQPHDHSARLRSGTRAFGSG